MVEQIEKSASSPERRLVRMWKISPQAFGAFVTGAVAGIYMLVQGFMQGFWEPWWLRIEIFAALVFGVYAWRRLWRRAASEDGISD